MSMRAFHLRAAAVGLLTFALFLAGGCGGGALIDPLDDDAVILAFGDSLTYGTGAGSEAGYPAVLERLTGRRVINAGVPGEVSSSGLRRLPGALRQYRPDLVILCHGGNDVLQRNPMDETEANIAGMIEAARAAGADVILVGVPRLGLGLRPIDFYGELAERYDIPCDDRILARLLSRPSLRSDQVHLNADGYEELARAIDDLIRRSARAESSAKHRA